MPSIALPVSLRGQLLYSTRIFDPLSLFAANEPGIWLDPSDVANLDWRRNLLTWTEQFDNAAWSKLRLNITPNATPSPDGATTADHLIDTAVSGTHVAIQLLTKAASAITYTASVYLKAAARTKAEFRVSDQAGNGVRVAVDLSDGSVGAAAGFGTGFTSASSAIQVIGNGWYRATLTATSNSATSLGHEVYVCDASGNTSYVGDGTSGIYAWGAQLELGSVATDYQKITDVNTEVLERFPKTTMFQDRAGTTPVTTPGQSVGLRLDKSKGLVLGSELRGGGVVSTVGTPGTLATFNTSTGAGSAYRLDGSNVSGVQVPVADGRTYLLDVEQLTGTLQIRGTGVAGNQLVTSVVGRQTYRLSVATGEDFFFVTGTNAASVTFTVHSVKELPGNHAVANSDAARGIYGIEPLGGRRNLLTFTEQFDNAAWVKLNSTITANGAIAPDGTTTADKIVEDTTNGVHRVATSLSFTGPQTHTLTCYMKAAERSFGYLSMGTAAFGGDKFAYFDIANGTVGTTAASTTAAIQSVGNGWYRCSITATSISGGLSAGYTINATQADNLVSYAGTAGSGILIWGAQLETGSTATAYQRVVDEFNVTEAGKQTLHYVEYVSGDGFVTPTITPGIDKVQVFAGVRRFADTAGVIAEYSANFNNNAGSWVFATGSSATTALGSAFHSSSRGTAASSPSLAGITPVTFTPPVTAVLAATHDISGDLSVMRGNGVAGTNGTADKGTGNFLAYPIYIGNRGGSDLFFRGRDYGIITRFGANLDASTIAATESWLNQKTGAY